MSLLLIIACVLLFLAAFGIIIPRVHPGWLGMAVWCLSILLPVPQMGVFHLGIEWVIVVVLIVVVIVLLVRPRGVP